MKNTNQYITLLFALSLTTLLFVGQGFGGDEPGEDPLIPGVAQVRVLPGSTIDAFIDAFNRMYPGTTVSDQIESRKIYQLDLTFTDPGQLETLENQFENGTFSQYLLWGELNYAAQTAEGKTGSVWVTQLDIGSSQYANQYAFDMLNVSQAQTLSLGQNVTVAVLDTGIDASHPDIAGHIGPGGYNFIDNTTNTDDAQDGVDQDNDGMIDEQFGHGTYVAGLILLVAPETQLLPVKVLDSDGGSDNFTIAEGIFHAIDAGVEVINISLGSTYDSLAVEDAVAEANDAGIFVAGAAGNLNQEEPEEHPATYDDFAFGIAAVDDNDIKAPFSNYHPKLFFSSPGDNKPKPGVPGEFDPERSIISIVPGNQYAVWEGTSFATAFASGAAALIRAQYPDASPSDAFFFIKSHLITTAINIYPINPQYEDDQSLGVGRIDIGAAVALGPAAPNEPSPDLNSDGVVNGADLGILLGAWGACPAGGDCTGDLNDDDAVNGADLGVLLGAWG